MDAIVFDVGGVLLNWDPENVALKASQDPAIQKMLLKALFFHEDWLAFDRGVLNEQALINQVKRRSKLSSTQVAHALKIAKDSLKPIDESVNSLNALSKKSYKLYCLSNMPDSFYQYLIRQYEFFQWFDGLTISCLIGKIKPEPAMYRHFLAQHRLTANRCVFIDDRLDNIISAKQSGFQTIHYSQTNRLCQSLNVLGVNV